MSRPKKTDETEKQWQYRCMDEDVEPRMRSAEFVLAQKWGMNNRMLDSDLEASEVVGEHWIQKFNNETRLTILRTWDQVEELPIYDHPSGNIVIEEDVLVVAIDLTARIPEQLAELKKIAVPTTPNYPPLETPQANAFLQGIRALDALEAGATNHEIGEVLFGDGDPGTNIDVKAHDCIKSAKLNMKSRYRAIARRSTPIPQT